MPASHAKALTELRTRITEEWTVDVVDHFCLSESRDGARIESVTTDSLVIRPRKAWRCQGMWWPTMTVKWDKGKEDCEVDGTSVTVFRIADSTTSRSTKGERQAVRTYRFHAPRAC